MDGLLPSSIDMFATLYCIIQSICMRATRPRTGPMGAVPSKPPAASHAREAEPPPPSCAKEQLLLATGIISAPQFHGRRSLLRHSWLLSPNVVPRSTAPVCAMFVIRSGGMRGSEGALLRREAHAHKDVLLLPAVAYNETRLRGPLLSLVEWLRFAAEHLSHATFIAKVDDDTWLHTADLARLLAHTSTQFPPPAPLYLGVHTYSHWVPNLFDFVAHGLTFAGAERAGRWCRVPDSTRRSHSAVTCVGPFAFAAGYLIVLSSSVVSGLVSGGGMADDASRLMRTRPSEMMSKHGRRMELIYEDVWLGSVLHRFPPAAGQPTFVALPMMPALSAARAVYHTELVWEYSLHRRALLTHIRSKRPEYYLATHALSGLPGLHCSTPFRLQCDGKQPQWCNVEPAAAVDDTCCGGSMWNGRSIPESAAARLHCHLANGSLSRPFTLDRVARAFAGSAAAVSSDARRFEPASALPLPADALREVEMAATSAQFARPAPRPGQHATPRRPRAPR